MLIIKCPWNQAMVMSERPKEVETQALDFARS